MVLTRVRGKGQITLPYGVRRAVRVSEGDYLDIRVQDGAIIMRPKKLIDADQAWFWTDEWQRGEHEASDDIVSGRTRTSNSADEFMESLEEGAPDALA